MTKKDLLPRYAAGEKECPFCGDPLPAHQTWPGARYRYCGKPACTLKVKELAWGRYIGPGERKCGAEGCSNDVPEGRYLMNSNSLSCSSDCWYKRFLRGKIEMTCACCGAKFFRRVKKTSKLVFLNYEHRTQYMMNEFLAHANGPLCALLNEYLTGYAAMHYRRLSRTRSTLVRFFEFLNGENIDSIEDVAPKTISSFLVWAKKSGRHMGNSHLSVISVFFDWLIREGRRSSGNPVMYVIHHQPNKRCEPRPLEKTELDLAWTILKERGNARLRFAAAVAQEAGLRIGEICNLRLQDVDVSKQRVFVRLPNKSNTERYALFGDGTKQYYSEWLKERRADCKHDHILHNRFGDPLSPHALGTAFRNVMCKVGERGKFISDLGFESWSTHRFRHTMASDLVSGGADVSTVMAAGGWHSYAGVCRYARVDEDVARRGYDRAMEAAKLAAGRDSSVQVLTPAQILERAKPEALPVHTADESQQRLRVIDCV